jgi:CheY-like chemotaxis protein
MNLCINARDAMPDGGKLVIETDRVHIDDDYVWRHEGSRLGDFVVLKISDTGIGIPKNIQERIFEPFFTTKGKNKGTGLGLATVYGIIKQSGGNIWVYSEPGRGTSFKIYLPVFSVKAEPKPELKHKVELRPERFKILVVEDEMMVRELVVESLENFGYIVLSAANGEEAIRLYKNHKDEIELILTDVVMPGLSGKQLIEAISKISEDFRVLYMSGYTDDIIGSQGELSPDAPFIEKPFSPTQLIEKIQSLMKSDTIAVI